MVRGGYRSDKDRFWAVFRINLVVFMAELISGWYSGSLSMISDGLHTLLHILVSLIAIASEYKLFGFSEVKIKFWSAYINIALFFPLAALIGYEAYRRLHNPLVLNLSWVFFMVAIFGLIANVYTVVILHYEFDHQKKESDNKNRFILRIHMIFDAIGSVIVIIGGVEIYRTGSYLLDPELSFVLAVLIAIGAIWMSWEFISGREFGHKH